ncbi:MAG: nickel pincer cofactor biosynthesis protein LarB [Firmicutes bacterium]|nr:nickel pincer cofactor biosynthesis protein LarB [Bacillota bacterium]
MTPDEALNKLEGFPYQELGFAKVDTHRHLRSGNAEVIYCPGKTITQIVEIFQVLASQTQNVMATRASKQIFKQIQKAVPEALYFEKAKIVAKWNDRRLTVGAVGVISAGTADLRVAEEASVTAELMGSKVISIYDVGVAGIHRLFDKKQIIDQCRVLIVIAGMEGALASVIGGLVSKPIIAVPTSVGYGANFKGLAALLSMINSCAAGIGVVNIDNGFGAGVLAHRINLLGESS